MAQPFPQSNGDSWLPILHRLLRELRSLNRAYARGEERTDELIQYLLRLLAGAGGQAAPGCGPPPFQPTRPRGPRSDKFLLDLAARRGVERLEFQPAEAGAAFVRVDGGKMFHLSETLAVLLRALAREGGREDGDLVGWKSATDLQRELETQLERPFVRHSLEQLICRLRKAFKVDGDTNPRFVMTHPEWGWRFALRKPRGV